MEAARGILLVLATVFIAAECFIPMFKRDETAEDISDYHRPSCRNALLVCIAPFQHNPHVLAVQQDPRTLMDYADEICGFFQEAADCVRPSLDDCYDQFRPILEASLSTGDFVCSSRGRSLLRDIQHTACYTEQATLQAVESSIVDCLREVSPESIQPGNLCQHIEHVTRCAAQVTKRHCGKAAEEFVTEIVQRHLSPSQQQCSNEHSQEFLKRSFGLLSKKRGLLI